MEKWTLKQMYLSAYYVTIIIIIGFETGFHYIVMIGLEYAM